MAHLWTSPPQPIRRLTAWWTLANVNTTAQLAFGLAGTVAALAAVNFFTFSPRVHAPAVIRGVVIDDGMVRNIYEGPVPAVVTDMDRDFSRDSAIHATGTYDAGPTLVKDCVLYQRDIELLQPKACSTVTTTGVDYPPYIHELITMEGTYDAAALARYQNELAQSRLSTPTPGASPPPAPVLPTESHALSDDALNFAYTTLRNAAVPVDVVTIVNNGHAGATNIQVTPPADLQPYAAEDRGAFDLDAGQQRVRLYRRAASSGGQSALASSESLPVEGFEVNSSSADTLPTQELARGLLVLCLLIIVVTVWRDVHSTPTSQK